MFERVQLSSTTFPLSGQYGVFGKGVLSRGRPDYAERGTGVGRSVTKKFHRKREYTNRDPTSASSPPPVGPGVSTVPETLIGESVSEPSKKREREETPEEEEKPIVESEIMATLPSTFQFDPKTEEPLQIGFEEAFFLAYVLECLVIRHPDGVRSFLI
jgi:hypothetical protein